MMTVRASLRLIFLTLVSHYLLTYSAVILAEGGQKTIKAPKQAIDIHFWQGLYGEGGTTIYCEKPFKRRSGLIKVSPIYHELAVRDYLGCGSERRCLKNSNLYPYIASDLHNLYPSLSRVELIRRSLSFAELTGISENQKRIPDCQFKTSHVQFFEPRDGAKGDIARALFYMAYEYNLPIATSVLTLKKWNRLDPPDEAEKARNDKIERIQGNRNIFIDSPELADSLIRDY